METETIENGKAGGLSDDGISAWTTVELKGRRACRHVYQFVIPTWAYPEGEAEPAPGVALEVWRQILKRWGRLGFSIGHQSRWRDIFLVDKRSEDGKTRVITTAVVCYHFKSCEALDAAYKREFGEDGDMTRETFFYDLIAALAQMRRVKSNREAAAEAAELSNEEKIAALNALTEDCGD